jgi:hypothetical protein
MEPGWYGINLSEAGWEPVTSCENRHSIALTDAYDADASHVGYWTGAAWEDVEEVASLYS